jgi:hypothetical protein
VRAYDLINEKNHGQSSGSNQGDRSPGVDGDREADKLGSSEGETVKWVVCENPTMTKVRVSTNPCVKKVHLESRDRPAGVLLADIWRLRRNSITRYATDDHPASAIFVSGPRWLHLE